ncbi:hypothetical protein OSB04_004289 [Centaurea solstitialis]|uniref:Helicase ATP-binding domain-containing protein n=1 Tax=Centaurea solstitialis TaxID=347529 RepID=A0AA38U3X7_9ASTR|nr:hypothetical protein OSB04_004289 [Centaurea solstitialis]
MGEEEKKQKFGGFPFKPYSIQVDFMNALYDSLDKGGIAMLESPTGTGKTLSIICSALQWLIDRKQRLNDESSVDIQRNETNGDDSDPDWMKSILGNKEVEKIPKRKVKVKKRYGFKGKKRDKNGVEEVLNDLFNHFREIEVDFDMYGKEQISHSTLKGDVEKLDDKEFLVEEYESEDEKSGLSKRKNGGVCCGSSSSSDGEDEGDEFSDEDEEEADFKIYFCSRTHSQLSQFVKELRKTVFGSELKVASLGSRKNFCINEEVLKLGSSTLINERCLDLQKNKKSQVSKMKNSGVGGRVRKTKASGGCPMLSKHKLQKQFRHKMTDQGPLDIEDLVQIGSSLGTCPYYGSRSMVPAADLVVLPYQSLLSKSSRESLGLSLKNSVVIIDEAHNLADSLISMYDSKITLAQLELVDSSLEGYFQRFRNLLGPGNRRHIQTLMVLTRAFIQTLGNKDNASLVDSCHPAKNASECSLRINEFVFSLNIDNINLVKLLQYIKDSNMIHKVSGYGNKLISLKDTTLQDKECRVEGSILSAFRALAGILLSLTNHDSDGRIILSRKRPTDAAQQGGYLKYVMLTGEKIFHEIVNEAHAVVLAGGTLQPIEETRERLFPWLQPDQLHFFSCGHIISSDNILPISVSHGPSGQSLDFSYSSRSTSAMVGELGLLLCNLVTVIPQGIVMFFSSFDYEEHVYNAWKTSGVLGRIMKKKHVLREPRKSTEVETVLKEYKESIDAFSNANSRDGPMARNGAVLLAVVGGKISEGINFSDGMGRCVVMVGLPYPSPSDIELMERVKHIDGLGDGPPCFNGDAQAGFDVLRSCKRRGREYYENLCMKAVNQSIGRAIRHINDYAAILLVDTRYTSDSSRKNFHPTNKLPRWIKDRLISSTTNYGEVHRLLHQFFKFHKSKVQMLLKRTIHKTRIFFNKTLQNFKSFIFGRYKKLRKPPSLNLFSTNVNNTKMQHLDDFYKEFCDHLDSDANNANQNTQVKRGDIESNASVINSEERILKNNKGSKSVVISRRVEEDEDVGCSKNGENRDVLEQKMKELEMMDMKDEEHVMDIEEVLHYYSLLTSPIYQGLVDKFFTDMYSEFFLPQPSIRRTNSINSSMRKLDGSAAVGWLQPSEPGSCLVSSRNHPLGFRVHLPRPVDSSPTTTKHTWIQTHHSNDIHGILHLFAMSFYEIFFFLRSNTQNYSRKHSNQTKRAQYMPPKGGVWDSRK